MLSTIRNLFVKPIPCAEVPHPVITEGNTSMWHYHLSMSDKISRGLCGAPTMYTAMPLTNWRKKFGEHFPKRPTWCQTCEAIYARQ